MGGPAEATMTKEGALAVIGETLPELILFELAFALNIKGVGYWDDTKGEEYYNARLRSHTSKRLRGAIRDKERHLHSVACSLRWLQKAGEDLRREDDLLGLQR